MERWREALSFPAFRHRLPPGAAYGSWGGGGGGGESPEELRRREFARLGGNCSQPTLVVCFACSALQPFLLRLQPDRPTEYDVLLCKLQKLKDTVVWIVD
uniref:Uncharacterized protein n=1 Tax=Sphaerodactylus townsendi TaxID=933632 RepID=A0ACB8FTT3_9SAUR